MKQIQYYFWVIKIIQQEEIVAIVLEDRKTVGITASMSAWVRLSDFIKKETRRIWLEIVKKLAESADNNFHITEMLQKYYNNIKFLLQEA